MKIKPNSKLDKALEKKFGIAPGSPPDKKMEAGKPYTPMAPKPMKGKKACKGKK